MIKIFTKTIIVCLLCFFALTASAQNVIYVDGSRTTGSNNGTSWMNAYTNLQTAIDAANGSKPIWVAKGVYNPNKQLGSSTDRRDRTFILKEGVKVYGGFAGSEQEDFNLTTRNFLINETILSGDFTGESGDQGDNVEVVDGTITAITNNSTNAYHVVVSFNNSPATVLDGFTVMGGNANGTNSITPLSGHSISRAAGGGIY